jgi:hypothetical protein
MGLFKFARACFKNSLLGSSDRGKRAAIAAPKDLKESRSSIFETCSNILSLLPHYIRADNEWFLRGVLGADSRLPLNCRRNSQ